MLLDTIEGRQVWHAAAPSRLLPESQEGVFGIKVGMSSGLSIFAAPTFSPQ